MMTKLAILLSFGICLAQQPAAPPKPVGGSGFQTLVKDAKSRIQEMNIDQLKALRDSGSKFMFVDVREDSEWTAGHAAGATHLARGILERDIEAQAPRKDEKIVLYCGGGARSALAADTLMKMGYTNVYSLAGGMSAYKTAGLPVEK